MLFCGQGLFVWIHSQVFQGNGRESLLIQEECDDLCEQAPNIPGWVSGARHTGASGIFCYGVANGLRRLRDVVPKNPTTFEKVDETFSVPRLDTPRHTTVLKFEGTVWYNC